MTFSVPNHGDQLKVHDVVTGETYVGIVDFPKQDAHGPNYCFVDIPELANGKIPHGHSPRVSWEENVGWTVRMVAHSLIPERVIYKERVLHSTSTSDTD